jgi:putative transposase
MDCFCLADPTLGVIRRQDELAERGALQCQADSPFVAGDEEEAIYPKRNLSRLGRAKYIYPYLLRGLKITRPNQVWAIDITYVPMRR